MPPICSLLYKSEYIDVRLPSVEATMSKQLAELAEAPHKHPHTTRQARHEQLPCPFSNLLIKFPPVSTHGSDLIKLFLSINAGTALQDGRACGRCCNSKDAGNSRVRSLRTIPRFEGPQGQGSLTHYCPRNEESIGAHTVEGSYPDIVFIIIRLLDGASRHLQPSCYPKHSFFPVNSKRLYLEKY